MKDLRKGIYIISTPIGNLDDITLRALDVLKNSDFIVCENPKHSIKLLNKFGIKKKLYSLHDYNEEKLIKKIQKYEGKSIVALISDAGSPLISDPGFKLIKSYIKKDIFVTSIPGASSVISSIQLSGLPVNEFVFFGFVPKNINKLNLLLKKYKKLNLTSIFFINGNNLKNFIETLANYTENIELAVCKELTKVNETVFRGNIKKIVEMINEKELNLKGEFTLIASGEKKRIDESLSETLKKQTSKLLKKYSLTETVEIVHKISNISKKEIYQMALKLKHE